MVNRYDLATAIPPDLILNLSPCLAFASGLVLDGIVMKRLTLRALILLLVIVNAPLKAEEVSGKVVGISDGDTLTLLVAGNRQVNSAQKLLGLTDVLVLKIATEHLLKLLERCYVIMFGWPPVLSGPEKSQRFSDHIHFEVHQNTPHKSAYEQIYDTRSDYLFQC